MMYTPLLYSSSSDQLYPPPGSYKYRTPKPVRNGVSHKHNSEDEEDVNCDTVLLCVRWIYSSPLFKLRFWKILTLIVLVVTTGHFSTVVMFHRITESLFLVKYDSVVKMPNELPTKAQEETNAYLQTHHRKMKNLIGKWDPDKLAENASNIDKNLSTSGYQPPLIPEKSVPTVPTKPDLDVRLEYSKITPSKLSAEEKSEPTQKSVEIQKRLPAVGSREKYYNSSQSKMTCNSNLKLCPPIPPNLDGPVKVNIKNIPPLEVQEKSHPELLPGGRFRPSECCSRHKVAIIIPFRDRAAHLAVFLHNIHPFLQKQQIDYAIYIVEQAGSGKFNRAMLMNVGSIEALKLYPYDCFIFHDVDLIPEDDRNLYTCPVQPRHMSVAINTMRYKLPYNDIFGGVSAMTVSQFRTVNGFSNRFWGWGGEDDDMSNRIKFRGFYISRYPANVGRYTMMSHKKDRPNPQRYKYLNDGKKRYSKEGLSNVKYKMLDIQLKPLYTWFSVELIRT